MPVLTRHCFLYFNAAQEESSTAQSTTNVVEGSRRRCQNVDPEGEREASDEIEHGDTAESTKKRLRHGTEGESGDDPAKRIKQPEVTTRSLKRRAVTISNEAKKVNPRGLHGLSAKEVAQIAADNERAAQGYSTPGRPSRGARAAARGVARGDSEAQTVRA